MANSDRIRKPASDHVMLRLVPAGWRWEWSRRVPGYNEDFDDAPRPKRQASRAHPCLTIIEAPSKSAENAWGLYFAEEPERFYGHGAVFWRPDFDPSILSVTALPVRSYSDAGALDLPRLRLRTTVLRILKGDEHVLFCNGMQSIQLRITEGTLLDGPVRLALDVHGADIVRPEKLLTAERLAGLILYNRLLPRLFSPLPQAEKWLRWLRAYDWAREGLSHPEIAKRLYDAEHVSKTLAKGFSRWPLSRVCRALKNAEAMIAGGYLKVLLGDGGRSADDW